MEILQREGIEKDVGHRFLNWASRNYILEALLSHIIFLIEV